SYRYNIHFTVPMLKELFLVPEGRDICRNLYKPMPIAAPEGRNILFISKKYCVPPGGNCFRALFYYKYSAPLWGQKSSLQILVHILKPEETFYIIKGYYLNSG
ncbi:MAG: hypothetical protein P8X42_04030, partial [Calditrichaceae bacterium]